jgi:uncharacterized protein (TIGR00369 family)
VRKKSGSQWHGTIVGTYSTSLTPEGYAVGIEISASHSKSATEGIVTAVATAISLGKILTVHEIVVTNNKGERCSTVRITNLIRKN